MEFYLRGGDGEPVPGSHDEPIDVGLLCAVVVTQPALVNSVGQIMEVPTSRYLNLPRVRVDIKKMLQEIENDGLFRVTCQMERTAFNKLVRLLMAWRRKYRQYECTVVS